MPSLRSSRSTHSGSAACAILQFVPAHATPALVLELSSSCRRCQKAFCACFSCSSSVRNLAFRSSACPARSLLAPEFAAIIPQNDGSHQAEPAARKAFSGSTHPFLAAFLAASAIMPAAIPSACPDCSTPSAPTGPRPAGGHDDQRPAVQPKKRYRRRRPARPTLNTPKSNDHLATRGVVHSSWPCSALIVDATTSFI